MEESKFIETLKLLNGEICHLRWHEKRLGDTFSHFFPKENIYDIKTAIIFQSINSYNDCAHVHISGFADKQHEIHPIGVDSFVQQGNKPNAWQSLCRRSHARCQQKLHQGDTTEFLSACLSTHDAQKRRAAQDQTPLCSTPFGAVLQSCPHFRCGDDTQSFQSI